MKFTPEQALAQLPTADGQHFLPLLQRSDVTLELYAPQGHDGQQPHTRDELYAIVRGTGEFVQGAALQQTRHAFKPGDVFFVPAHEPHRFEHFSDDFATWVMFVGPIRGEPA